MEEIIVAAHQLKELSELEMTPLTRERMRTLNVEIGGLLRAPGDVAGKPLFQDGAGTA